ncbi:MAG: twin-arginine translocase subunit TatC [Alphaproteobacteria bacterium]|nr:twin-arginine translocase subunit TatC [Alphaproteobacteria bacterium]
MSAEAANDDDEVEASRAPLMDHLMELRTRLLWSLGALVIAFIGCFTVAKPIFMFLVQPFVAAMAAEHPERAGQALELYNTHAFGFFFVQLQVALFAAIIVAFPVIAWQAYKFIAPGLYRRERAAAAPFLIAAPVMFISGAAFVFYIVMPFALRFALGQEVTEGPVRVEYLPKVDEYLSLVTTLMLAFGGCFQMPVVLSLLARTGMVGAGMLRKGRRYAVVGIAALAACVTPPDVISMTMMALPMYALYEVSIWLVAFIERGNARRDAARAAEETFGGVAP